MPERPDPDWADGIREIAAFRQGKQPEDPPGSRGPAPDLKEVLAAVETLRRFLLSLEDF